MARKLDRTRNFQCHGPGRGRDIYIQADSKTSKIERLYTNVGTLLPSDRSQLESMGFSPLDPHIVAWLENREVETFRQSRSAEIDAEVEAFKMQLIEKKLAEAKQQEGYGHEDEELDVDDEDDLSDEEEEELDDLLSDFQADAK